MVESSDLQKALAAFDAAAHEDVPASVFKTEFVPIGRLHLVPVVDSVTGVQIMSLTVDPMPGCRLADGVVLYVSQASLNLAAVTSDVPQSPESTDSTNAENEVSSQAVSDSKGETETVVPPVADNENKS